VTVAPGITAPLGSVTVPVTFVELPPFWACANGTAARKHKTTSTAPGKALANRMIFSLYDSGRSAFLRRG
jgi:hypothetical protein